MHSKVSLPSAEGVQKTTLGYEDCRQKHKTKNWKKRHAACQHVSKCKLKYFILLYLAFVYMYCFVGFLHLLSTFKLFVLLIFLMTYLLSHLHTHSLTHSLTSFLSSFLIYFFTYLLTDLFTYSQQQIQTSVLIG